MTEHIKTRKVIKDIATVSTFEEILAVSTLSEEDKYIMRQHYLHGKDFAFIADSLGYAEITIITKHRKIIKKLSKILR